MMQQISGVINLSIPVIIFYRLYPDLFYTYWGMFLCALPVGLAAYFLNRRATLNMVKALTYIPSLEYKEKLDRMIVQCGMDPKAVSLVYAYTNEQMILTAFDTLILDPVMFSSIADDPEAIKVATIFEQATVPTLSEVQKNRLRELRQILVPEIQGFLFKRQLAHIYNHFSTKKLFVIGFVATLAAYAGIVAGMSLVDINGMLAIIVGIGVGCIADLTFTYLSNALFKVPEEKAADAFAAQYSSREEIEATAQFFEQYGDIRENLKDPQNFLSFLPSVFACGHLSIPARVGYLRSLAAEKVTKNNR